MGVVETEDCGAGMAKMRSWTTVDISVGRSLRADCLARDAALAYNVFMV